MWEGVGVGGVGKCVGVESVVVGLQKYGVEVGECVRVQLGECRGGERVVVGLQKCGVGGVCKSEVARV